MWTPLFGLYLARAGLIAVDRRGGARALKRMVAAARKAARLGRPIVIFPEGTRVAPDQHRPYQPGGAALYGQDRKSVVEGKRVSVGVDLGGRRIFKKKQKRKS